MISLRRASWRSSLVTAGTLALVAASFAADSSRLPPPASRQIDFTRDVEPILEKHCYACHGTEAAMNGYSLWRRGEAMRGGYSGERAIVAGKSSESRLIRLVAGLEENLVMPPTGRSLSAEEISILRAWIDQGVRWAPDRNIEQDNKTTPWLEMDYGPLISASITVREPDDPRADKGPGDNITYKGHAIALTADQRAAIVFDTELLRYSVGWTGDFLALTGTVYDWKHGPHPYVAGKPMFENPVGPGWARDGSLRDPRPEGFGPLPAEWAKYRGYYVHGDRRVLSYTVGATPILDLPGFATDGGLDLITRTLDIGPGDEDLLLQVAAYEGATAVQLAGQGRGFVRVSNVSIVPNARDAEVWGSPEAMLTVGLVSASSELEWEVDQPGQIRLRIPASPQSQRLRLYYTRTALDEIPRLMGVLGGAQPPASLEPFTKGGPTRFTETVVTQGKRGSGSGAYVVDELTLPFDNPWKSWFRPGDFGFFSDDRAAVTTWSGDVWTVSGIDDDLAELKWKRLATGFYQPLGIEIVEDVVYVLDRNQITRLHDLNGDGEPDFYENFNNDFHATHHFHEFTFDLDTDSAGNFYFAKAARHALPAKVKHHGTILKLDSEGRNLEIVCTGFRVPNGVAVGPNGEITTSDQEGHWIPSTRINWCSPGSFHGYMWGGQVDPARTDYDPPIAFLPVGADNSGAGQAWVSSERWGPFQGYLVHSSFGRGKIFLMLMEKVEGQIQGGAVEFPLSFGTGLMRPEFRPQDGQLYVSGLYGWGTRQKATGGFYRVRYTGKPVYLPRELHVNRDGVSITFTQPLDPHTAVDPGNYQVQRWNYKWTSRYGSDLFKTNGEQGTEKMNVRAVKLSDDRRTVLLEIDDLKEVMQMQTGFRLKAADGAPIEGQISHTLNVLSSRRGQPLTAKY